MTKSEGKKRKTVMHMVGIHSSISIATLNINAVIKRQRLSEWIKNVTPLYIVYKKLTLTVNTHTVKVNKWRKLYHANIKKEKSVGQLQLNNNKKYFF